MKRDDFRKIYEEIDYTDEFKAEMRKKLSEPAKIRTTSDEYESSVEGVETINRSKITRTISTIAACGVLVAAGGAIGLAMKGLSNKNSDSLSSVSEEKTKSNVIEASTLTIDTTSEEPTEIIVNNKGYFNKLELPDIDPANDTNEEITEAIRKYVTAADEYCFESMLPASYPDYYANSDPDNPYNVEELERNGDVITDEYGIGFYAFKENTITLSSVKEDVLSVYSKDYNQLDEILSCFKEENGKLYCKWIGGVFEGFYDFSDSEIQIKSKDENKIVADVYMDFTDWVISGYNRFDEIPEEIKYLFGDNYKYEYPQQITLIREDNGWRISEYTRRIETAMKAKDVCPEYLAILDYIYKDLNYDDFTGTWTDESEEYELNIESIKDGNVTFKLSKSGAFSTELITADIESEYRDTAMFDTYGSEHIYGIEGSVNFCNGDNSITLFVVNSDYPGSESLEVMVFTKAL